MGETDRVLVVGGSSGIGLATAEAFAARGHAVTIAARDRDRLAEAARRIGARASTVSLDLRDQASVRAALGTERFLHVVLAAADLRYAPLLAMPLGDLQHVFDSKLFGYVRVVQAVAPRLPPDGSVTLVSGIASERPSPGAAAVAAVNGAIEALGRALAVELSPVRVNVVSPGVTDTPSWSGLGEGRERFFAEVASRLPAKRVGKPEDVAAVILAVATNRFSSGAVFHVDGGGRLS
ncbi:MAG TPA: SDR family oxidoreductase [Anaeromyxobacter sp.]|nr:SDR family oxidoreductase [Anaeromyxobacter sp.]